MDPALAFYPTSWQLLDATCAKLVNYPDKPAPAGSLLAPEVAQSLPTRSAGRQDLHVHDPQRIPLLAALQRAGHRPDLQIHDRAGPEPDDEEPGPELPGRRRGRQGIHVGQGGSHQRDRRARQHASVHLLAPAPDLPTRLALPFFCAVPLDTPLDAKGVRVIPSAGPYYVTSYTPGQGVVLKRNPNYTGSRPHRADRIELTVGGSLQKADAAIAGGYHRLRL